MHKRDSTEYNARHQTRHLLKRNYGERLTTLMDRFVRDWGAHRDGLNGAPLAPQESR
jgi:hypothetical protein